MDGLREAGGAFVFIILLVVAVLGFLMPVFVYQIRNTIRRMENLQRRANNTLERIEGKLSGAGAGDASKPARPHNSNPRPSKPEGSAGNAEDHQFCTECGRIFREGETTCYKCGAERPR